MTRTERAAYPRAVMRDRSLSRSGLEKGIRKEGGGAHNWGRLEDELELEYAALDDEQLELEEERVTSPSGSSASADSGLEKTAPLSPNSSMSEAEIEAAKQFRKNALKKGQVDLAAIARTSNAVSSSPPKVTPVSDTSSNASA
ncbi:hypothetical protein VNI00_017180 [Paramarasmius palmivorus]|uniref:Hyaluronan/mRNA-binding protein domain-containing protein n=1 Tax=Paramarasmius palmivorus TaxID=297713 RepID=A0AAW0B7L9_9AGAR